MSFAVTCSFNSFENKFQFLFSIHKRGQFSVDMENRETTVDIARSENPPGSQLVDKPLETVPAKVLKTKDIADQLPSAVRYGKGVGVGQTLEPNGPNGRGAENFGSGHVSHFGDDNHAGRYAYPDLKSYIFLILQFTDSGDDGETRMNRTFGVVLVSPRIAETAENAITNNPDNRAFEAFDRSSACHLVGQHDIMQIFGIKLIGKAGRVDQVAEQNG